MTHINIVTPGFKYVLFIEKYVKDHHRERSMYSSKCLGVGGDWLAVMWAKLERGAVPVTCL